jgi:hypothetical protein
MNREVTAAEAEILSAIRESFISGDGEDPANVTEGLYAVAEGLHHIGYAIERHTAAVATTSRFSS